MLPELTYEGGKLTGIELIPITLGWKEARHLRGRPRLAEGDEARGILQRFADLSKPFGTVVDVETRGVTMPPSSRA